MPVNDLLWGVAQWNTIKTEYVLLHVAEEGGENVGTALPFWMAQPSLVMCNSAPGTHSGASTSFTTNILGSSIFFWLLFQKCILFPFIVVDSFLYCVIFLQVKCHLFHWGSDFSFSFFIPISDPQLQWSVTSRSQGDWWVPTSLIMTLLEMKIQFIWCDKYTDP